jgi:hypothetical protein
VSGFILKMRMLRLYGTSIRPLSDWWREVWKRDPNELMCCGGYMCGCYGSTYGDMWEYLLQSQGREA